MRRLAKRIGRAGERAAALVRRVGQQRRDIARSEARFRDFAASSGDWFWETDAQGRFTWLSPQVEARLVCAPDWYIGRHCIEVIAAGRDLGAEPWKSHLETLARREPFRDLVYERQTPSGTKWQRVAGVPVFDSAGHFHGYRGSATDITATVAAERRARAAEERLGEALDHLNELIALTDAEDRIVYTNRAFREFNAAVAEHLLPGRSYADHLRAGIPLGLFPEAAGREAAWLEERIALRRAPASPVERQRQDGRWLLVQDRRLPDGGTITFGIDVTERKRAERWARIEHAVTQCLAMAATARSGIEGAMQTLCEAESWDLGEYWALDERARALHRLTCWASPGSPAVETFVERSRDLRFALGEGLPGIVWETRRPLWVDRFDLDPRVRRRDTASPAGLRAALLLPVTVPSGEVVGVLAFLSRQSRAPEARLQDAMVAVTQQIGLLVQRRRAEDELRAQTERLRIGQSVARMIVMDWDIRADEIRWSDSPEWLRGPLPADSGRYPLYRDQIHPEDREQFLAERARAIETLQGDTRDYRLVRTDGEVLWIHSQQAVFAGTDGKAARMLVALHDITARKRAEQQLREDEQRLGALVTWALDAIIITDAAQRIVTFNHAAEALFGCPAEAILGEPLERLIPARFREAHRGHVQGFASAGATSRRMGQAARVEALRADGTEFPVEAAIVQFRTSGRLHFAVMLRDVTEIERKARELRERTVALEATQKDLERALTLQQAILESTAEGVLAHDESRRVLAWNRRFARMWGIAEETLRASDWRTMLETALAKAADPAAFRRLYDIIAADPQHSGLREVELRDGRVLERQTQPIVSEGRHVGRVWTYRDVTARVRTEREREADRQLLQTVLDTMPQVVSVTDREHRYVRVNRAMLELTGAASADLIGAPLGRHYAQRSGDPGLLEYLAQLEERVLASGEPVGPYEVSRRDTSGFERQYLVRKLPLRDASGAVCNVVTVGDDITELKKIQDALHRMNDELEARVEARTAELRGALRELESFSYSVSHDLRAPARAVTGFARIVMDDHGARLPEEARRLLARISRAGEAMGAMVDGLLELSRITRAELARRPVDLGALAAEVWRDLAALEPERGVEFHLDDPLQAEGDPVLLRNLLLNLLGNARKYTRQRPDAAVWFGRNPAGEFCVRDNGAGFDMKYADKLFGAFQRLHGEREFEGHGIGLALARRIVERHGGAIRAEAEPGKGAVFFFTLGTPWSHGKPSN